MLPGFTTDTYLPSGQRYMAVAAPNADATATILPQARIGTPGRTIGGGDDLAIITQCVCPCCIEIAGNLFCCGR
jgi:hypothetical protein